METAKKHLKEGKKPLNFGVVVFEGYELLDTYGPLELIAGSCAAGKQQYFQLIYISTSKEPVAAAAPGSIRIVPTYAIDDPQLPALDIVFIPGGKGTRQLQKEDKYLQCLKDLTVNAKLVLTVCTGSMLFAATGLLDGKRATTNKVAFTEVAEAYPNVQWVKEARWVVDGEMYTSSGVSAGMDMTVAFLTELLGEGIVSQATNFAEYVPNQDPNKDVFSYLVDRENFQEKCVTIAEGARPGKLKVAVLVYDQFEMLDTFGPCEMFHMANKILSIGDKSKGLEMTVVAEETLNKSAGGPVFLAKTFEEVDLEQFDLLLIPGGIGTIRELFNKKFREGMDTLASSSETVFTVCTGSALLSITGKLDNLAATTNKLSFTLLKGLNRKVDWKKEARWVHSDKFYTSSGVSAGIDASLQVLQDLYSPELANEVAALAEYEWDKDPGNDPFTGLIRDSSMAKAGASLTRSLITIVMSTGMRAGFTMKSVTKKLLGPISHL